MNRISARYGRVSVTSVMFLLVGVIALSTAGRQPCLRACTGPWHTYKVSHMIESEQHESAVTKADETAEDVVAETETLPPSYVPFEETLPLALSLIVQKHHFRSPPFLQ